jgi:hypothetical protein
MKRWLGVLGLVFVALVLVSFFVAPSSPDSHATAAKVISYYHSNKRQVEVSAYFLEVAVFVGFFFFWYLRDYVAAVASKALATIGFAGAVLFAVSGALSGGLSWSLADAVGHVSPSVMLSLNVLSNDAANFVLGAGLGVFLIATSLAVIQSRAPLPVWLAWIGIVVGVAALVLSWIALLAVGVWILLACIVILVRANAGVTSSTA